MLPLIAAIGLAVSACGGTGERSPSVEAAGSPAVAASDAGTPPVASLDTPPAPVGSVPAGSPGSPDPTSSPPAASPEPPSSGTAAACAGSPENRDFYLAVAEAVDWIVLCPVLPDGWFVESGTYRLAGGGWLEIAYRGPAGARIRLREGAFCPDASGCVPSGAEVADVPVGPLAGRLITTDDGGWAVVVDRGAQRSWLLEGTGLDEEAFRSLAAGLVAVNA